MSLFISPVYAQVPHDLQPIECTGAFCADTLPGYLCQTERLVNTIVSFLTIIAGLAFFIYFMIGAISWLTAGGDTGKVDKAKSMMTNAAIGLIIIAAAFAITWIVGKVLGIDITNPFATLLGQSDSSCLPPTPAVYAPEPTVMLGPNPAM